MRAVDHYTEAEQLLADGAEVMRDHFLVTKAQVHALLALAGATALQAYSSGDEPELDEWAITAGGEG